MPNQYLPHSGGYSPGDSSHSKASIILHKSLHNSGSVSSLASNLTSLDPLALKEHPPVFTSSSLAASIFLAEPVLFVQGFTAREQLEHPPTLLRGSVVIKVTKPTKIKTIHLSFKGFSRTEWPEGIPPRKQEFTEVNQIHSQHWDLFDYHSPIAEKSSGADVIRIPKHGKLSSTTSLSSAGASTPPYGDNSHSPTSTNSASFQIHLSNTTRHRSKSNSTTRGSLAGVATDDDDNRSKFPLEDTHSLKGLANRLRRAASPSPIFRARSRSPSLNSVSSNSTVSTKKIINPVSTQPESNMAAPSGRSPISPSSSFSISPASSFNLITDEALNDNSYKFLKKEPLDREVHKQGFRTFMPGEYIYYFESPLSPESPESIEAVFGSIRYYLEVSIERPGVLKSHLSGRREVKVVRTPCDESLEFSEPICISKDWEDKLHYEIIILGKASPLETSIPIAFKLTPLAKIKCHRIRVYITEHCEYWCRKKKVHRIEPPKKFLLFEKKANKTTDGGSLLCNLEGVEELYQSGATEFEIDVSIPGESSYYSEQGILRSNYNTENIKINHWIKIVLRLSLSDPNNPEKRKHFEISIDSPFHLLDARCKASNIMLPKYLGDGGSGDANTTRRSSQLFSSATSTVSESGIPSGTASALFRRPSVGPPPPFDSDVAPPTLSAFQSDRLLNHPPNYDSVAQSGMQSYVERFQLYQQRLTHQKEGNSVPENTDNFASITSSEDIVDSTTFNRTVTNEITINTDLDADDEDESEPLPNLTNSITREVMVNSDSDMDSEDEGVDTPNAVASDREEVPVASSPSPCNTNVVTGVPFSSNLAEYHIHSQLPKLAKIHNIPETPELTKVGMESPISSSIMGDVQPTSGISGHNSNDNSNNNVYVRSTTVETTVETIKQVPSRGRDRGGRKNSSHSTNPGPLSLGSGSGTGVAPPRKSIVSINSNTNTRGRNNSSSSSSSITTSSLLPGSYPVTSTVTNAVSIPSVAKIDTSSHTSGEISPTSMMNLMFTMNDTGGGINSSSNNTGPFDLSLQLPPQMPSWVNWNTHPVPTPSPGSRMQIGRHGSIVSFDEGGPLIASSTMTSTASTTTTTGAELTQTTSRIDEDDNYFSHETSFQFSESYTNRLRPILSTTSSVDYCEIGPRGYPRRMDSVGAAEIPLLRSGSVVSITSMRVPSNSDNDDEGERNYASDNTTVRFGGDRDDSDDGEETVDSNSTSTNHQATSNYIDRYSSNSLATREEESALSADIDELSISPGESSNGLVRVARG